MEIHGLIWTISETLFLHKLESNSQSEEDLVE